MLYRCPANYHYEQYSIISWNIASINGHTSCTWGVETPVSNKCHANLERPTVPNRTPRSSQAASDATSAATSILTYLKWEKKSGKQLLRISCVLPLPLVFPFPARFTSRSSQVHPIKKPCADLIPKRVSPWLFSLVSHKPYLPYGFA